MSTPSPPRRVSDEADPSTGTSYDNESYEQYNSEFGSTSTNPGDNAEEAKGESYDESNGRPNESESRNNSPQRVLSPSEEQKERAHSRRHPFVQDETQLKTLLNVRKDRLLDFLKKELKDELAVDFVQYLDQNSELKDSELYPKLREYLVDHGHVFETISAERCFEVKASEIQAVLPKKNFNPESILHVFCEEGNILAELKAAYPSATTVIGADCRDIRTEENRDKFEFIQFEDGDPFKLEDVSDESADIVILTMKLYKYEQQYAILDELKRVMKRGAFLVLCEFDCSRDENRLFNDVVNGFYATVLSDPVQNENFCSTYRAYYKPKFKWESLLERRSLFSFKDSPASGLFRTYYASFKKDVARGSSSRKRGLVHQSRGPGFYPPNQYVPNPYATNLGPPFKRRRFENPQVRGGFTPMRGGFSSNRGRGGYAPRGGSSQIPVSRGNNGRGFYPPNPNVRPFQDVPQSNWNVGWNQNAMWNGNNWNQVYPQQTQPVQQGSQHVPPPHTPQQGQHIPPQNQYIYNQQPRYNRGSRNFHYNQQSDMTYQGQQPPIQQQSYQDPSQFNS